MRAARPPVRVSNRYSSVWTNLLGRGSKRTSPRAGPACTRREPAQFDAFDQTCCPPASPRHSEPTSKVLGPSRRNGGLGTAAERIGDAERY